MARHKGLRTRTESRCAEQDESRTESTLTKQHLQEAEAQSTTLPDLVSSNGSSFEVEHPEDNLPPWEVLEGSKLDIMMYPYLRYNKEADVRCKDP